MRKMILLLLAICMTACLMACGSEAEQTRAEGEATEAVAEESEDAGEMTAEELQAAIEALEEDDEEETTGKYRVFDDYKDGELISNMAFTYNGQTVTAPYTVGDLIDMGLVYNSELRETEMVEPGELNKSYTDLYTANENWVHISACNTTDSPILLSECYVTEISANNNEVTMNGVTPGVSTYEDVLELREKTV